MASEPVSSREFRLPFATGSGTAPGDCAVARRADAISRPAPSSRRRGAGRQAMTVVPRPGADSIVSVPPTKATRSLIPRRPSRPAGAVADSASNPTPSSSITATAWPGTTGGRRSPRGPRRAGARSSGPPGPPGRGSSRPPRAAAWRPAWCSGSPPRPRTARPTPSAQFARAVCRPRSSSDRWPEVQRELRGHLAADLVGELPKPRQVQPGGEAGRASRRRARPGPRPRAVRVAPIWSCRFPGDPRAARPHWAVASRRSRSRRSASAASRTPISARSDAFATVSSAVRSATRPSSRSWASRSRRR